MQRYNQCSAVRMYVMSVTHLVLGAAAVKFRSRWFCVPAGTSPGGFLPPAPPLRHALQAGPTHQARHPVAATPLARIAQVFPDPRTPHDAVVVGMQLANLCQ